MHRNLLAQLFCVPTITELLHQIVGTLPLRHNWLNYSLSVLVPLFLLFYWDILILKVAVGI